MDRATWLRGVRRTAEERYDTLFSATYDEHDLPMTPTHRAFVARVAGSCPSGGTVLDAPCGTGKYFDVVLEAGRAVAGIDQSAGMLAVARSKHPEVRLEKVGLQELAFAEAFDGVICVDAMENVSPEDWPIAVANLRRAVKPGGLVYLTVEQIDRAEVVEVFEEARSIGLPVVPGEHTVRGGGYHYYPTEAQVLDWVAGAGLEVVETASTAGDGYGYWHLLLRRPEARAAE